MAVPFLCAIAAASFLASTGVDVIPFCGFDLKGATADSSSVGGCGMQTV